MLSRIQTTPTRHVQPNRICRLSAVVLAIALTLPPARAHAQPKADLLELSLEQLMNVSVSGVGTLTHTRWRDIPASVTHISAHDITQSGARSLDDLLEIFVPGFQVWLKTNGNAMGMRGIISDRNTKVLLLVNGRLMNEHTSLGVYSERYLSLLGDINYINVIRGPGASIYGPGAIAGVINIQTFDGNSFSGQRATVRAGAVEEFYSAEYQAGDHIDGLGDWHFYYGIDDYLGADNDDAALYFSRDFTNSATGTPVAAYEPVPFAVPDYHAAHREQPRHKLHLDYTQDDFSTWLRYTKGGQSRDLSQSSYSSLDPATLLDESYGYQQFTLNAEYQPKLTDNLSLDSQFSYDVLDVEYGDRNYREDELFLHLIAQWQPSDTHKLAGGIELSKEYFGKKSIGYPDTDPSISTALTNLDSGEWSTQMLSLLLDYQWYVNTQWTLFAGVRFDNHTYIQWMTSPRIAAVFSPTKEDRFKLLLNRSVRRADDDTLREYHLLTGYNDGRTEDINALELSWEHQWQPNARTAASLFYNDYNLIAWDSAAQQINEIGTLKLLGLELEGHLNLDDHKLTLLYTYVDQQDFSLASDAVSQFISASVYGYGDSLANWAAQSLKLIHRYTFNPQWSSFTSLRSFWDLDGTADMARYNRIENNNSVSSLPRTDGRNKAFESRAYLDLGLEYQQAQYRINLHAYNILGWGNDDWNRRNVFGRADQYRAEAAALALSASVSF